MVEAVTWSFISKPAAELFGGGQAELALANPIASDLSDMRPSLLPGLVAAAQANANRGYPDVALFEVGQIFRGDKPEDQFVAASGVRHGFASSKGMGRHWSGSATADALDAKADAFAVLAAAGAPMQALQIVPGGASWLHPGRSGTIQIGPQNVLGYFGELHPRALEALGADGPLIAFEVILDRIPEAKKKPTRAKPVLELSAFQPVSRDFAFIVDRGVKAGDIVRAAQGVDKKLITDVTVFDVYEGKGIDDGKKSIAIAVTIQPREKTLTDQEIDAVAAKIVAEVTKKTGGTLRGMMPDERFRTHHADAHEFRPHPTDVSLNAAIAICAIAFVSGTARGFSGFGSALIFMPLASSIAGAAAGRGAAADHRFRRGRAAAPECVEAGRPQGDRDHGARRPDRRADRNLLPQPARARDDALDHFRLRRSRCCCCCSRAGATAARIMRRFRSASAACRASAAGWRRPAARRSSATGSAARSRPAIARANIVLFFGASDFFSVVSYAADRTDHGGCDQILARGRPGLRHRRLVRRLAVRQGQRSAVPRICYALIAAAVIVGLPALDGVLR